jgi:DNA-binding protein HU-beta
LASFTLFCGHFVDIDGPSLAAVGQLLLHAARGSVMSRGQKGQIRMNNNDLAESLAGAVGLTKVEARKHVDAVIGLIADAAAKGDEVSLSGFGKFKVKETPAREGRNPSTGATIQIAASRKLTFSAAKALKDKLNG